MSTDFYFIWNVCNLFILFDIKVYAVPPSFLFVLLINALRFLFIWFHSVCWFSDCITRLFKLCVSYLYFILGIAYRMVYFDCFVNKSYMIYI